MFNYPNLDELGNNFTTLWRPQNLKLITFNHPNYTVNALDGDRKYSHWKMQ